MKSELSNRIVLAHNLDVLRELDSESVDTVYADPPFGTGKVQTRTYTRTVEDELTGDRTGFGGKRYRTEEVSTASFNDTFTDYLSFLRPVVQEVHRVLKPSGCFYLHLDYREVHYAKVMCDEVFGRANFVNEIIWAFDFGARSTKKWPAKHNNILYYAKNESARYWNTEEVDREPYMAPGLVGAEKAAKGKLPTTVWWHTIVSPTGKEKQGYPTQKPLGILRRIIRSSTPKGGLVVDPFAGSGTTGVAAVEHECSFLLIDSNPEAVAVMRKRFADREDVTYIQF